MEKLPKNISKQHIYLSKVFWKVNKPGRHVRCTICVANPLDDHETVLKRVLNKLHVSAHDPKPGAADREKMIIKSINPIKLLGYKNKE